jgi:hypothetical protein
MLPLFLIGKVLFVFSSVIWLFGIFAVPFLPLKLSLKAWVAGTCIVIGEIAFYVSAILLGKEVIKKYRKYFDPRNWFRK